jgi:hypothetical protein
VVNCDDLWLSWFWNDHKNKKSYVILWQY